MATRQEYPSWAHLDSRRNWETHHTPSSERSGLLYNVGYGLSWRSGQIVQPIFLAMEAH
ncbi:MAG TPA: hypothetical protein VMH89_08500 [Candidatus Acidoferrum sp.]|nr:hypothetical protein [Candidatus Acidoferrum sp.]